MGARRGGLGPRQAAVGAELFALVAPASLADLDHAELRAIVGFLRSWERSEDEPESARSLSPPSAVVLRQ